MADKNSNEPTLVGEWGDWFDFTIVGNLQVTKSDGKVFYISWNDVLLVKEYVDSLHSYIESDRKMRELQRENREKVM